MAATQLRYLGLVSGLADGGAPRLQVATPAGSVREIPVTRAELVRLIRSAAGALEYLDRQEAKS